MSEHVMALVEQLEVNQLVGKGAFRFGAPDRVLLVSGGPPSHLAKHSLIAAPPTERVVIRQPSRSTLASAEPHEPLKGEIHLTQERPLLEAEVEEWKHGSWYHSVTLRARDLEDVFAKLNRETSDEPFNHPHTTSLPQRAFWSGALAYDLVQWTQPLRLQHPPSEGALLAVLWQVNGGVVIDHHRDSVEVFGQDDAWCRAAEACISWNGEVVSVPSAQPHREAVTHTDETHEGNVEAVRQGIINGQVYQVNIGKHWQGEIDHPYAVYQRLLRSNPAPFSAYTEAHDLGLPSPAHHLNPC